MKILFIAPIKVPHINLETYLFNALNALNIEFIRYGYNEMRIESVAARVGATTSQKRFILNLVKKSLPTTFFNFRNRQKACALFKTIEKTQPDLILAFSKVIPPKVIDSIKKDHPDIPLVGLAVDDPQDFDRSRTHSPHYHLFFSNDSFSTEKHCALGANCHWLPFAADPELNAPIDVPDEEKKMYASDIVFIGSVYAERAELLRHLADYNLAIWGPELGFSKEADDLRKYYRRPATETEVRKIYSCSKMVINPQYGYGKNVDRGNWVNLRIFEAACNGIFQLTDYKKDFEDLYDVEKEMVYFRDATDLKEKVQYYLEHSEIRKQIAQKAHEKTMAQHLYTHRLQYILEKAKDLSGFNLKGC